MPVRKVGLTIVVVLAIALDMLACRDIGDGAQVPDQPGSIRLLDRR